MGLPHFININSHMQSWRIEESFYSKDIPTLDEDLKKFNSTLKVGKLIYSQFLVGGENMSYYPNGIINPQGESVHKKYENEDSSCYFYLKVGDIYCKLSITGGIQLNKNTWRDFYDSLPELYNFLFKLHPELLVAYRYKRLEELCH